MWAGVAAEREVFNLFSGAVRQQGLNRMEAAMQRQSLVPDLRIAVQPLAVAARGRPACGLGGAVEGGILHEVKVIRCNETCYTPILTKRAVDIRAEKLQEEYMVKAWEADRVYNHTPVGTIGAMEQSWSSWGRYAESWLDILEKKPADPFADGLPGNQQSQGGWPLQREVWTPAE